jgi:hypothetical protein
MVLPTVALGLPLAVAVAALPGLIVVLPTVAVGLPGPGHRARHRLGLAPLPTVAVVALMVLLPPTTSLGRTGPTEGIVVRLSPMLNTATAPARSVRFRPEGALPGAYRRLRW